MGVPLSSEGLWADPGMPPHLLHVWGRCEEQLKGKGILLLLIPLQKTVPSAEQEHFSPRRHGTLAQECKLKRGSTTWIRSALKMFHKWPNKSSPSNSADQVEGETRILTSSLYSDPSKDQRAPCNSFKCTGKLYGTSLQGGCHCRQQLILSIFECSLLWRNLFSGKAIVQ